MEKPEKNIKIKRDYDGGIIYCLGVVGAIVYFIQHATSFWDGVVGFLQALVWPALLVYHMLNFLKL